MTQWLLSQTQLANGYHTKVLARNMLRHESSNNDFYTAVSNFVSGHSYCHMCTLLKYVSLYLT